MRLCTIERVQERLLVKIKPRCTGILVMPVLWEDHQAQQQLWRADDWSLESKLCVLRRAEPEKGLEPPRGSQKVRNGSQTLDVE